MSLRKQAISVAFATALLANVTPSSAQDEELGVANSGVVVEIYVHGDQVEIVCPTTQCNAKCRDIEGSQQLLAGTFYQIGSNCSITITDGALLQEAIETVFALVDEELPGAPPPNQSTIEEQTQFLDDTTSNPNQNTISPASPVQSTGAGGN